MDKLSNQSLLEVYKEAIKLNLNEDFLRLIQVEIMKRKMIQERFKLN